MTRLEDILKEVDCLSDEERTKLLAILLKSPERHSTADERASGQHGLASWTESTRGESWSEFYPDSLNNGGDDTA
ncbi:MAG: hypothetical protein ACE5EQ_04830 [Phycisphaerae bacterium]